MTFLLQKQYFRQIIVPKKGVIVNNYNNAFLSTNTLIKMILRYQ